MPRHTRPPAKDRRLGWALIGLSLVVVAATGGLLWWRQGGSALAARAGITGVAAVTGVAGAAGAAALPQPPEGELVGCAPNVQIDTPQGRFINNMWNGRSAGPGDWRQCLVRRVGADGQAEHGWWWLWPNKDGLYAYPQVMRGMSPWAGGPSSDARFPRRVDAQKRLVVTQDVAIQAQGRQNLALDIWVTHRAPVPAGPAEPGIIKAELMVWTQASAGLVDHAKERPLGRFQDAGGVGWTVFAKPGWGDASGGSALRWTLISYHSDRPLLQGSYDLQALLNDAVARGLLLPGDWLSGVELGNEIVSGSGQTWVRRFDLNID